MRSATAPAWITAGRSALLTALVLAMSACAPAASRLELHGARVERRAGATVLQVECDWKPSPAMLEALDHGIALTLQLDLARERDSWLGWRALQHEQRRLELRYYPLTRRYQLQDLERGTVRSFGVRAAALAALTRVELPLADPAIAALASEQQRLRIVLDKSSLPGALRLPALIDTAWRQDEVERTWPGIPQA